MQNVCDLIVEKKIREKIMFCQDFYIQHNEQHSIGYLVHNNYYEQDI